MLACDTNLSKSVSPRGLEGGDLDFKCLIKFVIESSSTLSRKEEK